MLILLPSNISDVNVSIPRGKLTIVVGEVGSGKTALVNAILQEMCLESVGYHSTVKRNIIRISRIILVTKTTAVQNEDALSYYRVRGLYFLAFAFVTNIDFVYHFKVMTYKL